MTVSQAVEKADILYPNSFPFNIKTQWLEELDGRIRRDFLSAYSDAELPEEVSYTLFPETKLLAEEPFQELYTFFLAMQFSIAWGDDERYKNFAALFNSSYLSYMNYINRNHPVKNICIDIE